MRYFLALLALLVVACSTQSATVETAAQCTLQACRDSDAAAAKGTSVSQTKLTCCQHFQGLAIAALIGAAGCGPHPTPVPPTPTAAGGTIGMGGSSSVGGKTVGGASSAAGGDSSAVTFPACNETQKAPLLVRPPMSGWHKDPVRAKCHKARPSYSLVPGAESVFRQVNVKSALNQLNVGKCTAEATCGALSTHPFTLLLTDVDSDRVYHRATEIDPFPGTYPPTDTGSNGVSAWQAAIDLGYTTVRTTPVDTLEELQSALQRVPCILGTDWYEGFFNPTKCGEMVQSGAIAGGHEIEILGWDKSLKRVWIRNSWGDWGVSRGEETGFAYFSAGTLQKLLNSGAEIDCPSTP